MSKAQLYALTKQKIVLLAVAVIVSQVSLFGAGYLLSTLLRPEPVMVAANGQPCTLPGATTAAASQTSAPANASPAPAVAGAEKSATGAVAAVAAQPAAAEAALQSAVTPKQVPPEFAGSAKGAAAQAVAAATNPTTAPAAAGGAVPEGAAAAGGAAPAPASAAVANPRVAAEACENAPDIMNASADMSSEPHKYSVQIGAFLDANNALRLASEFKVKGYKPCLMIAADKQGRRWTVVRIGSFEDVSKASTYARSITGREQTVALVRPADSF